jgi:hypothetical protein
MIKNTVFYPFLTFRRFGTFGRLRRGNAQKKTPDMENIGRLVIFYDFIVLQGTTIVVLYGITIVFSAIPIFLNLDSLIFLSVRTL